MVTLEEQVREMMKILKRDYGWRFSKEELEQTPLRVKAMYDEWKVKNNYAKLTVFEPIKYGGMVVVKNIRFYAVCSHHLAPFFGEVAIGYLPYTKVYGVSKFARMVGKCAYQAQTQERMTQEILDLLQVKDAMVAVRGKHLCMAMRGIKDPDEVMITESMKGQFNKPEVRAEFRSLVGWE